MKRLRITFEGAFHHTMNRGINGEEIFSGDNNKAQFLDYLVEYSTKLKIRILAYCLLDNHYHMVIENSSGRMSDFFKHLNGKYGMYYRKTHGGQGYVFQSRFKSTLIEDDSYLRAAIAYLLLNPVRAGIVTNFKEYTWSSAGEYFSKNTDSIVDSEYVNDLFETEKNLVEFTESLLGRELQVLQLEKGEVLGSNDFMEEAFKKYNRRESPDSSQSIGVRRSEDKNFETVERVFHEFENKIGMSTEEINTATLIGKKLRGELLVWLKDYAGLKYTEIAEFPLFNDIRANSLPQLYKNARRRK
jgi:REP element-mobilizing transposase RayT